jgi:hypothetical protein
LQKGFGPRTIASITEADVRRWRADLLSTSVSPVTAAKAYRLLKGILATAVEDGLISRNPCRVKGASVEKSPERPTLTVAQVYALADAVPRHYRALILLARFCGPRWGELVLDEDGDLLLQVGGDAGGHEDALAEAGQGLVQDAGLPVRPAGTGQVRAFAGPPVAGDLGEPLTQRRGGGDQDRGQQGAGGLGRGDGIVPAGHQQPQRLAVSIGAHLGWPRAGKQLPRGAHGIDGVTFACAPLAHVTAGIDLRDMLARAGQVPGQAQPVMPGAFHRPHDRRVLRCRLGPGQQPRIAGRGRWDLQLHYQPPAGVTPRRRVRIQVRINPHDQAGVLGKSHCLSSFGAIL